VHDILVGEVYHPEKNKKEENPHRTFSQHLQPHTCGEPTPSHPTNPTFKMWLSHQEAQRHSQNISKVIKENGKDLHPRKNSFHPN
jgi:hypothetical protein